MKTKQAKEEPEKSIDENSIIEPKTRARKKASDNIEDTKSNLEEPKTSKEAKKNVSKPKAIVKKRPVGIRKALRSKKVVKEKVKAVLRKTVTRARKAVKKVEPENSQNKETVPLIPASDIKNEPLDDTNSRSSSPKTAGRRQRVTSDIMMMKTILTDTQSPLVLGPRTSPYSMRSERSNSPLLSDSKSLRSGKPRKKNILLNEVVIKEQKKRRRLLSDSKTSDVADANEDCKKLKRGRSCSRDGSEFSKSSDITESDISLNDPFTDMDSKDLSKKLDKCKTDLDIDNESNVQISSTEKVPSLHNDSSIGDTKISAETSCVAKKKLSLKRSTSLDSDNNSNRIILETLNTSDIEEQLLMKTENDTLFEARSSILDSMSKTFNSKTVTKNIRKARRGKKAAATGRSNSSSLPKIVNNSVTAENTDEKQETLETLSKEIDDLINDLDQNIDRDHELASANNPTVECNDEPQTKSVSKFYGLSKPLGDNNSIIAPETPVKDKDVISSLTNENTPSKTDDSENIRLHYDEDSVEKSTDNKQSELTYKCNSVASIDKLMDRLKEFEEFDKRRQRLESESKPNDSKSVMVTNDVVLIPKSGADIKPLKDIQPAMSPEQPIEKGNVLSCFENNSAISLLKRDQVRKSLDIDLPNSVTLIKRNSFSARKESSSSNHSKEPDAISIFEKSLGKDVTLTEIRKSVDKSASISQIDLHQLATLHPNTTLAGVQLNTNQISIMPRTLPEANINSNDVQLISKHRSPESLSRKSLDLCNESDLKMATIEKLKSPAISITPNPVAAKSEVTQPIETEALPPPLDNIQSIPEETALATEILKVEGTTLDENVENSSTSKTDSDEILKGNPVATELDCIEKKEPITSEKMKVDLNISDSNEPLKDEIIYKVSQINTEAEIKVSDTTDGDTVVNRVRRGSKSARNSIECQAGPSNILLETPESQKRKESILRTLGLLTHKAAKEAKIEKLKEKERIYKIKAAKSGAGPSVVPTGNLKTVIKLNRTAGDKKKYRSSLKMTFQKSKNRSGKPALEGSEATEDNTYYTIERREAGASASTDGGQRKSHYSNRINNHDAEAAVPEPAEPKETLNLVIPEKASSFSIHPGRVCRDQCFYCGGKFGLFDTPCHIAQMKSLERQKKVLDNEEKLTVDSCLCDACYRHVDRRANCPSYRKRPIGKPPTDAAPQVEPNQQEMPPPPVEEESEEDPGSRARSAICHTQGCTAIADNAIRRKWLIKMRSSVNKLVKLECDYPGLHTIPLCAAHHALLAPLLACALCRRRLSKHHNGHSVNQGYKEVNPYLKDAGIPVQFTEKPLLCKVCRIYCSMLLRSGHEEPKAKGYRRKLLQIYNIEIPPENENEPEPCITQDESINNCKQKRKQRTKSKQKKLTDPDKTDASESSERTSPNEESSPEKKDDIKNNQPVEEDIESLISSNKILVPGAMKATNEIYQQSDGSESEALMDDTPIIPLDKQTELQYLLQKQNNPAQFLQKNANLTQKQKNIMKLQSMSGVHKISHQHRINEKNAKRIHKLGQVVVHRDKPVRKDSDKDLESDKSKDSHIAVLKNITLNDECTIETITNKKPTDINHLRNKWQMSESFTQVKKNLSELSKKLPADKDPKKSTDMKYSNPVKRLETNPSISVRELLPGEEEMNLLCNIEFNNVKGVTPEGWEKCNSIIQYDAETKKLWTELQRPYGNLSSFLRHLILLEKHFRNGDLILAHNASPHAVTYSDSVQSRLRAYDNVPNETPKRCEVPVSLIEYRKKPAINGKSLLKSNQKAEGEKSPKKFMPPPGILPKPKGKTDKPKAKPMPPELIAINTPNAQGRKAIQNVLHNIQQLVKGVSASDPTEVAAAPVPIFDIQKEPLKDKQESPKTETPKKQKITSKPWRPTLMPITPENLARIAREPTQVAVDGRSLPSLVQVMSSGKRYHITLQDYNKMCVMRREKLQQLNDVPKAELVADMQSAALGCGGALLLPADLPAVLPGHLPASLSAPLPAPLPASLPAHLPAGASAASILKNVGLKNITIAPIPPKTATVTSITVTSPAATSLALLAPAGEAPGLPPGCLAAAAAGPPAPGPAPLGPPMAAPMAAPTLVMPKIPKSLTVIPQPGAPRP